jgi:hypothetical protein
VDIYVHIGVPLENQTGATRVAATPEPIKKLIGQGHKVTVQSGAGITASVLDSAYEAAGATIGSANDAFGAELILKVVAPSDSELALIKSGSTVRLRRTEHGDHPCQSGFGTGAHVHGLGGETDGVDADHRNRSRRKVAQAAALSVGQFTLTVPRGCGISTQIFDDAACEFAPASCMGNGIKAGCSSVFFCVCTRIHLWTRFALRLWFSATLAIEAPDWAHS